MQLLGSNTYALPVAFKERYPKVRLYTVKEFQMQYSLTFVFFKWIIGFPDNDPDNEFGPILTFEWKVWIKELLMFHTIGMWQP